MISLLERSVSASELLVLIIVIRALLLHRLPKITFQIMWAVVILRLLLPCSVELPSEIPQLFSVYQRLSETESRNATSPGGGIPSEGAPALKGAEAIKPVEGGILSAQQGYGTNAESTEGQGAVLPGSSRTNAAARNAKTAGWLEANRFALRGIWLTGTILCLLYFTVSHLRCRRLYAQAIPVNASVLPAKLGRRVRVKVSDRISAPLTYGILFPVILLSKITDWNDTAQLRMILEHEAVHIRRLDVLYKCIMTASVCIHWFNPFVWVMYVLAGRDMELSCDETVVKRFENGNRADYALALLNFEEKRSLSPMFTRFSGNAVKERIEAIMKLNKTSMLSAALAAVLVAGATTVFAAPRENTNVPFPASLEENTAQKDAKQDSADVNNHSQVKQYLCEPSYYTPEEFEALMEEERQSIEGEVKAGALTREAADEMLKTINQMVEDVRNGKKAQAPSPVFYSDGTPVVNSKGEQLYAKASDIEEMNAQLRYKAEMETAVSTETTEYAVDDYLSGDLSEDLQEGQQSISYATTELFWYTYEEYQEYAEQQKKEYAAMLGAWGFNSTDGWYEWTEDVIAKACAQLDENLKFIKDGGMISKPSENTDGALMIRSMPETVMTATDTSFAAVFPQEYEDDSILKEDVISVGTAISENTATAVHEGGEWDSGYLKAYEPYGITADQKAQYYLFNGKPIAGFCDKGFRTLVDGVAKENSGVYVKVIRDNDTVKEVVEISKEEFSKLTGLTCD